MSWPSPAPGLVIRYAYLWAREVAEGREEGAKDRPCAVVLVVMSPSGRSVVRVLPVTHSEPADSEDALEIPLATKARLGLDGQRSWIMLTEANDFFWPGPDLRPHISGNPASVAYAMLPPRFFNELKARLHRRWLRGGRPVKRNA